MTDEGLEQGSLYRWRLARATAASLALHMIFFGGLSVSRLDLANEQPPTTEAHDVSTTKRKSDFRLQVSRSTSPAKPAHERPLSVAVPMDAARPLEAREQPVERRVVEHREESPEAAAAVPPSRTEFERSRTDEQTPVPSSATPQRVADVTPAAAQSTADMAAAAAATESTATAEAAPAATQGRDRGDAGPVAARWRPREVALLEKLTASAPDARAITARAPAESPSPAPATQLSRRSATSTASPSSLRATTIAPAATQSAASVSSVAPAARDAARRPNQAVAAAGSTATPDASLAGASSARVATASSNVASMTRTPVPSGAPGGSTAGGRSPTRASSVRAGEASGGATVTAAAGGTAAGSSGGGGSPLAPAAAAASREGRSGRQGSQGSAVGGALRGITAAGAGGHPDGEAASGTRAGQAGGGANLGDLGSGLAGGREGLVGAETTGGGSSRSPGRDAGMSASANGTSGGTVTADAAGSGGIGAGGGSGTATTGGGSGGAGESLMPAAIGRRSRIRSALASRGSGTGGGESDGAGEGLSVSPADITSLVAAGSERGNLPTRPQGSRSLERITAAALPTDGRVRDVAEAFAGRSDGAGEPAGGISDRDTLDRARVMVDRGLDFLVRSQLPDGRWRLTEYAGATPADTPKLDSDTAATGLALLCFLGAGHDHFSGPHRDTVRRGLEFLIAVQQDDGDLFLPADDLSNSCSWLYSHGIASIAICEAVGMTGDPLVKPAAEKACRFITTSRHPTLGGWRYVPRTDADLSVSGWMLVALRAGALAGVKTDPAALEGVRMLMDASASPSDPTRYAYNVRKADQRRTDLSVACMTAVGTLMRLHTGAASDDPGVLASAKLLATMPPSYGSRDQKVRDSYLWYYASQVLVHTGGNEWQTWYGSLVASLEQHQRRDGPLAGSWDAMGETPDRWGEYGGRLYVTTLHLLTLEVPWRHLPTSATATAR